MSFRSFFGYSKAIAPIYWVIVTSIALISPAFAQYGTEFNIETVLTNYYADRTNDFSLSQLDYGLMGESHDIDTGGLSFRQVDVSLPGNSSIPVEFVRRASGTSHKAAGYTYKSPVGYNWDVDIPYTVTRVDPGTSDVCGDGTISDDIGDGWFVLEKYKSVSLARKVNIPGQGEATLGVANSNFVNHSGYTHSTKSFTLYKCTPSGPSVRTSNGMTYEMGYKKIRPTSPQVTARKNSQNSLRFVEMENVYFYATKITDVHGNWVQYEYNSYGPTRIWSNDGREITINYLDGLVSEVIANGRSWSYSYNQSNLKRVALPDNRYWSFGNNETGIKYNGIQGILACEEEKQGVDQRWIYMTHPSGTKAIFKTRIIYNFVKSAPNSTGPGGVDLGGWWKKCVKGSLTPSVFATRALYQKDVTLTSGETSTWTYDYEETGGSVSDPDDKTRTVIAPDGSKKIYYVRRLWYDAVGLTKRVETFEDTYSTTPVRIENVDEHVMYPSGISIPTYGGATDLVSTLHMLPIKKTISQDGDIYTTEFVYNSDLTASDYSFAKPIKVKTYSNVSSTPRLTETTYEHDKPLWILNLTKTVTQNNRLLLTNNYTNLGQFESQVRFGVTVGELRYNSDGTIGEIEDAIGRITKLSDWKRGKPETVIRAFGTPIENLTLQSIDDNGWVIDQTDAMNRTTTYSHDSMGRVTQVTPHGNWEETFIAYDFSGGGAVQTITRGQSQTTVTYDGLFRPTLEQTKDLGTGWESFTNTAYDALGRTTFKSLPSASAAEPNGTAYTYDGLGRIVTQTETAANAATFHEYLSGHKTRITDPLGNSKLYTSAGYDGPGSQDYRLIQEYDAALMLMRSTEITKNIWSETEQVRQFGSVNDAFGNLGTIPSNQSQFFYYNAQRRLCGYSELEGGDTYYQYDDAGQMIAYSKGKSGASNACPAPSGDAKVSMTYDDLGRVTFTDFAHSGTPDIARDYDANGNLKYVNRGTGVTAVNWDYTYHPDADLLIQESLQLDGETFNLSYAYNNAQHMVSRQYPGGRLVSLNPDGMGRATDVYDDGGRDFTDNYTFHPSGAITQTSYASGYTMNMGLNARLLPQTMKVENSSNSQVAMDLTYAYDLRGKVSSITDGVYATRSKSFTYDGLGQLLTNTGSWGIGNAVYDSLGNIHSRKLGPRTIDLQYDSNNRVYQSIDSQAKPIAGAAKVNGWGADGTGIRTVDYDDRGNVTTLGTMSFYYDYSDQPTVVSGTKTDGTSLTGNYRYDGNLRRVRNQVNGKTIYNVFDASGALVHTRDFGNNKTADYIRANGETVARWGQGHWIFDHKDHLGSTVAATHANGNVNARVRYAPFGLAMDDPTKLRDGAGFTGHLKDSDTGLNYMQARYYDPIMGRFLSIDPVTFLDTGMPGQFNRYAYTWNDPINANDPDGEFLNFVAKFVVDVGLEVAIQAASGQEINLGAAAKGAALGVLDPTKTARKVAKLGKLANTARKANKTCCFVAGTLVETKDGLRSIEDIEVGELVWARDEETGEEALKPVLGLIRLHDRVIWDLETVSETGETHTFGTTDDHPWWVDGHGWKRTDELNSKDILVTQTGEKVSILSVTNTNVIEPTFNFEVADFNTYFVGESKVWVHNASFCGVGGPKPNGGVAKPHGGTAHNQAIDNRVESINADPSVTNVRKNQQQVDVDGNKVGLNRPDVQYDQGGCHHCVEYDTKPSNGARHGERIRQNDPNTKIELNDL